MEQLFYGHLPRKTDPSKEEKVLYVNIYNEKQVTEREYSLKETGGYLG